MRHSHDDNKTLARDKGKTETIRDNEGTGNRQGTKLSVIKADEMEVKLNTAKETTTDKGKQETTEKKRQKCRLKRTGKQTHGGGT